jgi:hypothetical protein
LGRTSREVPAEWNGDRSPTDRRGATIDRVSAAADDERLLRSAIVVGRPSWRTVSALTEESRAITGLTSTGFVASTRRKTRSSSEPGLLRLGDLVVRGPVITTPI